MSDSETGDGVPLIEPLSRSVSPSSKNSGKRKRDDDSHGKKAKKKKAFKQKPKDIENDDLDEELRLNLAIGRMDGQLLVDHVAQRTKRFEPELSTVEREDRYLPGTIAKFVIDFDINMICSKCRPRHQLLGGATNA
jgi:protein CMS1